MCKVYIEFSMESHYSGHGAQGGGCQIGLRLSGSPRLMVRPPLLPIHHKYKYIQIQEKYEYKKTNTDANNIEQIHFISTPIKILGRGASYE